MMVGNLDVLARAKSYLYANSRLLDRRRFEYHFEGGSKRAVIDTLLAYQNPDGGFGQALEPDIRCPLSQPVPTEMALQIMDEIDAFDPDLVSGIARYLRSITLPEGGFPLVFRSASDYPHTPWWKTEREDVASINPTGTIIGMLYKHNVNPSIRDEDWFRRSVDYVWRTLESERPSGYHIGIQWIEFLQHTPEQDRAQRFLGVVNEWLQQPGTIERDPSAHGYVHKVLDWAPVPSSYARRFVADEDIRNHLRSTVQQQQDDGGWPIRWQAVGPGAEAEWRGWVTVVRLRTLKAYGWI